MSELLKLTRELRQAALVAFNRLEDAILAIEQVSESAGKLAAQTPHMGIPGNTSPIAARETFESTPVSPPCLADEPAGAEYLPGPRVKEPASPAPETQIPPFPGRDYP